MNWDAIGSIGEIVGAFAVVISVVYLAYQVKKQVEESRLAASRQISMEFGQAISQVTANLEFTDIWRRACQNYNELPDTERLWASFSFQRVCRMLEQLWLHERNSNIDPVFYDSFHVTAQDWFTFPGVQQWWEASNSMFGTEFKAYINQIYEHGKSQEYVSSFKEEE